jgi:nucleoside-diphosphate-sugar epimerase
MPDHLKTVLITGSAGFIGLHTVKEFVGRGWFVYALVHRSESKKLAELQKAGQIKILNGDITSFGSMKKVLQQCPGSMDAIVHCAGRASDIGWAGEFKRTNFDSIKHLVELTKQHNVKRLVFVSTTDVYGMKDFNGQTEQQLGYDETARNNYPKYKILAEKWLKDNLSADRYSIVRPAAVWGDDDPTLTKRIRDFLAWSPFIVHFGKWKGKNRWPMVHVSHVAKANFMATISPHALGKAINVLEPQKVSMDDFYRMIADKYFPDKKHKTLVLPFWLGICIGGIVSCVSNLLNLKNPVFDPSLYALYSTSKNLDFSCDNYQKLIKLDSKNQQN